MVEFFLEFIPQMIFFLSIFGYMVICIVIKWTTNWEGVAEPPSIINLFINFVGEVKSS